MSDKRDSRGRAPGTVTIVLPQSITIRTKYLWATLATLMVLFTVAPVAAYYFTPAQGAVPVVSPSAGGGGNAPAVNCQNPCRVVIKNSVFGNGQTVIVSKGTQVIWVNADDTTHTSTSDSGIWDTGIIPVGTSAAPVAFNKDGVFPYFCNVHPMTGVIEVGG
jgi:plastocyanin